MGVRNRARKFLLQARYAAECNGDTVPENLELLGFSDRFGPDEKVWIGKLAEAVDRNRPEIDSRISPALENWSLERLSILTRLVLEQAVAEAAYLDAPPAVAIDEALDLAREFEGDESVAFVNGVLDRILVRGVRAGGGAGGSPRDPGEQQEGAPCF